MCKILHIFAHFARFCIFCTILHILHNSVHFAQFCTFCTILHILHNFVHFAKFCTFCTILQTALRSHYSQIVNRETAMLSTTMSMAQRNFGEFTWHLDCNGLCNTLYDAIQWCVFETPIVQHQKQNVNPNVTFCRSFCVSNYIQLDAIINPGQFKKDSSYVPAGRAALEVQSHMKQLGFHPEVYVSQTIFK